MKKTILIDFDGVLNNYDGNYDENVLPEIKIGAEDFVKKLSNTFKIKVFTTRNKIKVTQWLIKYKLEKYISDVTNVKEPAYLIIDDRCINFSGDYDKIFKQIKSFNVYYK